MKKILVSATFIVLAGAAWAGDATNVVRLNADQLTWKDHLNLPKGAQLAILQGDPSKAELVVQRVKLPPNYKVPPHTHPMAENVTVLSGRIGFGMGEKFEAKGDLENAGAFYSQPAKHAHFVWTGKEGAIVQVQYVGPGGISYINPADDPRKK